jgi:hypothetical protein
MLRDGQLDYPYKGLAPGWRVDRYRLSWPRFVRLS